MSKELIIRSDSGQVDFALMEDGRLTELHRDEGDTQFAVGDIFIAKARKCVPGLNAAFVNVGYEKDGFLHYHDLGPNVPSLIKFVKSVSSGKIKDYSLKNYELEEGIDKDGKIVDAIKVNQSILVQVIKEPISSKGPRLNSEISLAGRYLVLVPFSDRISISQKIEGHEEKDRLKRLVKSIAPKGFGVIIRTVAQDKKVADLDRDLSNLYNKWIALCKKIPKASFPTKIHEDGNKAFSILRDIFNDSFTSIVVDDESLYYQIKDNIAEIAPQKESIVKFYQSSVPIFEKYGVEREIKTSFGRHVSTDKGASLIIEHTEALHVIDVNSGKGSNNSKNPEEVSLEVNLLAATEIARQLRLRDMGGIIVIDFIDLGKAENRKQLFNHFRDEMKNDRAKHKILPPSKFGLIQMTRQRVRPEMEIKTKEKDPNGGNNEEVEAPILLLQSMTLELESLIRKNNKKIVLHVHPFIAAFLKQGFPSIRMKWYFKHKVWVKILPRDAYTYLEFHYLDPKGKRLR